MNTLLVQRALLGSALGAAGFLVGCGVTPSTVTRAASADVPSIHAQTDARASAVGSQTQLWILQGPGLEAQAMATDPEGIAFFSNPARIVMYPVKANVPAPAAWNTILWQKYDSLASFQTAISTGTVPVGTVVVGYDDESWPQTPANERANPIASTIAFAQLAHANGFKMISMPAEDLMYALVPHTTDKFAAFIAYGMAGAVAPYVDYFHSQSQDLENSPSAYLSYVQTISAQARTANPKVIVTGGIATVDKAAPGLTAAQIDATIVASSSTLDGYWLNLIGATTPLASAILAGL